MQEKIIKFIQQVFSRSGQERAVIGVSGGIDSALSLTLLVKALPAQQVTPLLLPYGDQDMADAQEICVWNGFSVEDWQEINIQPIVDQAAQVLGVEAEGEGEAKRGSQLRLGNLMARVRMMTLFDTAKKLGALVVGTENKSENLLGYFTRFGDEASDLEPLAHLYKTQVRQLASELQLPAKFLSKPPSAGLWTDQTDEQELGFSYDEADKILIGLEECAVREGRRLIDLVEEVLHQAESGSVTSKVCQRVKQSWFKQQVPYKINSQDILT